MQIPQRLIGLYREAVPEKPLDRQYGQDFWRHEWRQVARAAEWFRSYRRAGNGESIGPVELFSHPLVPRAGLRAAISDLGASSFSYLSALQDSLQQPVLALFREEERNPADHTLVRILKARKIVVPTEGGVGAVYGLMVEAWEPLPQDEIYVGLDYEPGILQKRISETIAAGDKHLVGCFAAPLLGAPKVINRAGGVGLASLNDDSRPALELLFLLERLMPPEYRSSALAASRRKTRIEETLAGKVRLARAPLVETQRFGLQLTGLFDEILRERRQREAFAGELSVASALVPSAGNMVTQMHRLFEGFTASEVALPTLLREVVDFEAFIPFARDTPYDEVWPQLAHARRLSPALAFSPEREARLMKGLRADAETILGGGNRSTHTERFRAEFFAPGLFENVGRLTQAFARGANRSQAGEEDFARARGLFVDNLTMAMESPHLRRLLERTAYTRQTKRSELIQTTLLAHGPSTFDELWEAVRRAPFFEEKLQLAAVLESLMKSNLVILGGDQKYRWV